MRELTAQQRAAELRDDGEEGGEATEFRSTHNRLRDMLCDYLYNPCTVHIPSNKSRTNRAFRARFWSA